MQRVAYGADTRAEELFIGCLSAVLLPAARRKVPSWIVLLAGLSLAVVVLLPLDTSEPYLYGGSTVVAVIAAVIIAGLSQQPGGLPARLLSLTPLVWVGQRSYGIYLWHLPVVAVIAATGLNHSIQLPVKIGLTF